MGAAAIPAALDGTHWTRHTAHELSTPEDFTLFFRAASKKTTQSPIWTPPRHCYNTAAEKRQALIYAVKTEWVEMSQDSTACLFQSSSSVPLNYASIKSPFWRVSINWGISCPPLSSCHPPAPHCAHVFQWAAVFPSFHVRTWCAPILGFWDNIFCSPILGLWDRHRNCCGSCLCRIDRKSVV